MDPILVSQPWELVNGLPYPKWGEVWGERLESSPLLAQHAVQHSRWRVERRFFIRLGLPSLPQLAVSLASWPRFVEEFQEEWITPRISQFLRNPGVCERAARGLVYGQYYRIGKGWMIGWGYQHPDHGTLLYLTPGSAFAGLDEYLRSWLGEAQPAPKGGDSHSEEPAVPAIAEQSPGVPPQGGVDDPTGNAGATVAAPAKGRGAA